MIRLALSLSIFVLSFKVTGQPYAHSLGVRAGYSSGITYKGFLRHRMSAIEADVLYNRHGFNASGIYEYHVEPFHDKQWLVYFGGGAFGGNWEGDISMGIVALTGMEYIVRDLPLSFSIDWRPMMNAFRIFELDFLDVGVSIRYRFSL